MPSFDQFTLIYRRSPALAWAAIITAAAAMCVPLLLLAALLGC